MQDDSLSGETHRRTAPGSVRAPTPPEGYRPSGAPSSSRMFAAYLADIEQLLDAQRREAALREALDLPRIAIALSDPQLRCNAEAVQRWCEEWIRPPGAEKDAQGVDYQRLARGIEERLAQSAEPDAVPTRALRRLQLRRHTRTAPRGFRARRSADLSALENDAFDMSAALIEGARRWYARSACHDPIVQANLARLAVLR
jgi:hypothetical protein